MSETLVCPKKNKTQTGWHVGSWYQEAIGRARSQSPLCEERRRLPKRKPAEEVSSFVIPLTLDRQAPQDGPKTVVWEGDLPGRRQRQMTRGSHSSEKHCYLDRHTAGWRPGEAVYSQPMPQRLEVQARPHVSHQDSLTGRIIIIIINTFI